MWFDQGTISVSIFWIIFFVRLAKAMVQDEAEEMKYSGLMDNRCCTRSAPPFTHSPVKRLHSWHCFGQRHQATHLRISCRKKFPFIWQHKWDFLIVIVLNYECLSLNPFLELPNTAAVAQKGWSKHGQAADAKVVICQHNSFLLHLCLSNSTLSCFNLYLMPLLLVLGIVICLYFFLACTFSP